MKTIVPEKPRLRLVEPSNERKPAVLGRVDAQVQQAIALMQESPETRWTVNVLARKVGMSRAAFARRFLASTGLTPVRFLTGLRMQRARDLLCSPEPSLAAVADQVGYTSEFAFNRAFKRHHQVSPGRFRRRALERGALELRLAA